jgi:hypothetical protein
MHIPCVQPACDPLQVELPATTSSVHTGASGNRASGSSPRHLLLLTPTSRSLPMIRIAPKHWSSCNKPPSSCSHHLPARLRSARIVRCGENVKVRGGDKEGSSSQGCLPEVIPRCVTAGRRSPPDISLTLSVRRADLRRFTRRSRRRYHSCSSALRVLDRTLTGSWRRSATVTPSYRHGRAVPPPAVKGTARQTVRRHLACRK